MSSNASSSGLKAKTSSVHQPAMSRDLKNVAGKKPGAGGGVLHERTGSQLNKKASLTSSSSSGKKNDAKQQSLFGFKGFGQISKESSKTFNVFNDENKPAGVAATTEKVEQKPEGAFQDRLVQTDITGDYTSVTGHGDLAFYKELAERRREALNDSLKENESLVSENAELRHENFELKNENVSLLESVDKANRLAEMLEPLFSKTDDDDVEETPESVETKTEEKEKDESNQTDQGDPEKSGEDKASATDKSEDDPATKKEEKEDQEREF